MPRDLADVWVDGVTWPARLTTGGLSSVVVTVGAQRAGNALVELREGTKVLATRAVPVAAGMTPVTLDVTFDSPGGHQVDATVAMPGDPLAANNRLSLEAFVRARPKVLYVESAAASARYLQGALTGSGFDVAVRQPS
jgi:hypothetical protein